MGILPNSWVLVQSCPVYVIMLSLMTNWLMKAAWVSMKLFLRGGWLDVWYYLLLVVLFTFGWG